MNDAASWVQEIPVPIVAHALRQFARHPHCLFLDSAKQHPALGRYSFLMADPIEFRTQKASGSDPLLPLQEQLTAWRTPTIPGLPPFQGGAAGLLGYELGHCYERLPAPARDEFAVPTYAIGVYDVVLAIDHQQERAWLISQGFPETDRQARADRAEERGREVLLWLEAPFTTSTGAMGAMAPRLSIQELAPQNPVSSMTRLTSNFSMEHYIETVQRAVDYIHAGDIFQVNLSQRFLYPAIDESLELYLRLRARNASTFAAYFDIGEFQVLSASPERFMSLREGTVETRPIKGTRERMDLPEADLYSATALRESQKDRSENVMIVDLLRNDLSRVCEPDSVIVTQLCEIEKYEYVQHLVSVVQGRLAEDKHPLDLVRASFPGGSITGAPKVRAMEVISELEPTARGPYCGSLGYLGFDGCMDLNILIRTITAGRGWWQLPAGGGIVADSQPVAEYRETIDKARGMVRSLV